jgi:multiple sugar transport system permease protein
MKGTQKTTTIASQAVTYGALAVLSLLMLLPFLWMLSASIKPEIEVFRVPVEWIPSTLRLENYREMWTRVPFLLFYRNTVFVAVMITGLQVATCSLAAYAFSKIEFRERDLLFLGYLGTLMVPYTVIMIPQFVVIRNLGLVNNLWSVILINAFSPFGVFLFRQFFMTIPNELSESARIDGARERTIYWKLIMPLSKPAIASLVVFQFVYAWNDFLGPLIYLTNERVKTLQLGMRLFVTMYNQEYALMMAAAVVAMLPAIIVFLLAQDFFIKGITTTGMKG